MPALGPDLWSEVHDEAQKAMDRLEVELRRKLADLHVVMGSTRGESFYLFSYRSFSSSDADIDPVVAGVTFTPTSSGVLVEADVSGEQTGDILFSTPPRMVSASKNEILAATREAAGALCESADRVVAALADRSRIV
jgi:hypothetical protein